MAALDLAGHLDHPFAAELLRLSVGVWGIGGIEDHLGEPTAVPQVDEDEAAVVAPSVDPSGQGDCLALVLCSQVAAGDGLKQGGPVVVRG